MKITKFSVLFLVAVLCFTGFGCRKGVVMYDVFHEHHNNNSVEMYKCTDGVEPLSKEKADKSSIGGSSTCFKNAYLYYYTQCMNKSVSKKPEEAKKPAEAEKPGETQKSEAAKEPGETDYCVRARNERNYHIDNLVNGIDVYYYNHRSILVGGDAAVDTVMDVGTYVSSASATLIKAADTKSMLAALTGVIAATKNSVDKNFFLNNSAHAIALKMDAMRAVAYNDIKKNRELPIEKYSLDEAVKDLYEYYVAGTVIGASISIAEDAGKTKKAADDEKKNDPARIEADKKNAQARVERAEADKKAYEAEKDAIQKRKELEKKKAEEK